MGLIFMIINILTEEDEIQGANQNLQEVDRNSQAGSLLQVKFFGGPCQGEVHTIQPSNQPLRVGRQEDCDVHIDDSLLSKYQCSIEYSQSSGWILKDGKDNKPSTNGTWLYIGEEQTIYNGMIFKASQTLFQASTC